MAIVLRMAVSARAVRSSGPNTSIYAVTEIVTTRIARHRYAGTRGFEKVGCSFDCCISLVATTAAAEPESSGSGFAIGDGSLIVTSDHVVNGCSAINIPDVERAKHDIDLRRTEMLERHARSAATPRLRIYSAFYL